MADVQNSVGMQLMRVKPGSFVRENVKESQDEKTTTYEVRVTKGFLIGRHEVTQAQWKKVMGTEPWVGKMFTKSGDDYPATFISWIDANEFCKKLSKLEKRNYRLPTEAEWELACRGGTKTPFSFGKNEKNKISEYGWTKENTWALNEKYAHQVGLKKPNPLGLYDMHGNASEWCVDGDQEPRPQYKTPVIDPVGPAHLNRKVLRSGCWCDPAAYAKSGEFNGFDKTYGNSCLGLRVVLELPNDSPKSQPKTP